MRSWDDGEISGVVREFVRGGLLERGGCMRERFLVGKSGGISVREGVRQVKGTSLSSRHRNRKERWSEKLTMQQSAWNACINSPLMRYQILENNGERSGGGQDEE